MILINLLDRERALNEFINNIELLNESNLPLCTLYKERFVDYPLAVAAAFPWKSTPEGERFWEQVNKRYLTEFYRPHNELRHDLEVR